MPRRHKKARRTKKARRGRTTRRQRGGDYSMVTEAAPVIPPMPLTRAAVVTVDGGPTLSIQEWLKDQDNRELGAYQRP